MPICTSCTHPTQYLYTVYDSSDNLRLEQCTACQAFADPYVEHDTLTLWIDLILLKRDVYRHLLFNRGAGARKLSTGKKGSTAEPPADSSAESASTRTVKWQQEKGRRLLVLKLGLTLVAVDAFIRWTHLSSSRPFDPTADLETWNQDAVEGYLRIFVGCLIETAGFHGGVVLASFVVLQCIARFRRSAPKTKPESGISSEFCYSQIPLSLLYSSLNKLFLLFLLAIWRPANPDVVQPLPASYNISTIFTHPVLSSVFEVLDDDKLDREWVVRNIMGGMAAGFGLRVVLDCHPALTTMIILVGWAVKTVLANLVSDWVSTGIGGDAQTAGEMWLAYSIP